MRPLCRGGGKAVKFLSYLLFALALNLDSFTAGLAYGARRIVVPVPSLFIISAVSMAAVAVSMLGGEAVTAVLPVAFARRLGGLILVSIGFWVLAQSRREKGESVPPKRPAPKAQGKVLQLRIRPLGLAVQVLKEPERADLDSSGIIQPREALLLGLALALDALGAGFAFSLLGFSIPATVLVVGAGHFTLALLGIYTGRAFCKAAPGRHFSLLPGIILMIMGVIKIYR